MKRPPGQLFGQVLRSAEFGGLILSETIYPPQFEAPKHSHELFQFCLVKEGSFTDSYGRRSRECRPLTFFSHPAEEEHRDVYHRFGARCFVIEIGDDWRQRLQEYPVTLRESVEFDGGLPTWLASRLYDEYCAPDNVSPLAIEGLTLEIIAAVTRYTVSVSERIPAHWLKQVRDLLNARFAERLTLGAIAESVGVHRVYLASSFRKHYRCTIGDYIRRLRIQYACTELRKSDMPLVEISLAAGFSDQAHFTKTFKRYMGTTPSEYRARLRRPRT